MKTTLQKEMRIIRLELKLHNLSQKRKEELRKKLASLKEQMKNNIP